jgi:hypothetical protein
LRGVGYLHHAPIAIARLGLTNEACGAFPADEGIIKQIPASLAVSFIASIDDALAAYAGQRRRENVYGLRDNVGITSMEGLTVYVVRLGLDCIIGRQRHVANRGS